MKKEYFLSIISGQQRGVLASLMRSFLSAFTYPYSAVLNTRNALYRYGIANSRRLPVKVISIGNITMGGTGKTPLVEFSTRYLQKKGKNITILSRGYGDNHTSEIEKDLLCTALAQGMPDDGNYKSPVCVQRTGRQEFINDEYLTLKENLRDVPVLLGRNRVQNGIKAIRDYGADCLILDDGFQHLRIKRDLDIVVIDSLNPFAEEAVIPRGTLREPLKNLSRADLFVLSHCNQSNEHSIRAIYERLHNINNDIPVCESIHEPVHIENMKDNSLLEPSWLKGKRIYIFCAIGNPESFIFTLKTLGAELLRFRVFHDHHYYTQKELDNVIKEAKALNSDAIVVTQKDLVKIRNRNINDANILSLKIEMKITKGMGFYEKAIDRVLSFEKTKERV